jgi:hypothetical protein
MKISIPPSFIQQKKPAHQSALSNNLSRNDISSDNRIKTESEEGLKANIFLGYEPHNLTSSLKGSILFGAAEKKDKLIEADFSEALTSIPNMMKEMLLWLKYLPKNDNNSALENTTNTLDYETLQDSLEENYINQLYALMALKGSGIPSERKNLIKKLLIRLKEENGGSEFGTSSSENLLLGCLIFTPMEEGEWKKLYINIQQSLLSGEVGGDEFNQYFSQLIRPFSPADQNALDALVALNQRVMETAKQGTKENISPISLWLMLNTDQPGYSKTRLSKISELLQKGTSLNLNYLNLNDDFRLLITMPIGEKKWQALIKKIIEQCITDDLNPTYLMFDEPLTGTKEENENWFKNLQLYLVSSENGEETKYYTGVLKIRNQVYPHTSDPKRADDIQRIINSIDHNNENKIDYENFNHLNELLFSPIPYPVWKSIIAPIENGAKRGNISSTIIPALTLAAQYILSTPAEKYTSEAVTSAHNFLDEYNQDDQINPVFLTLLNIQSQTSVIPKNRQKAAESLLQELMAKDDVDFNEKILNLYFTMPIDESEWKAITEGVTELTGLGRTPDLIEVMVQTSINDTPSSTLPLPWLQQLKDVATAEKHALAGLIDEQYRLMFGDLGLPEARKQKLINALNQIWANSNQFSPLFQEAFKLITTAPVKTEQQWSDLLESFVTEVTMSKGKKPASLLIDHLENLDENDFTYPVWLSQLKELSLKEGTKDTVLLDFKVEFAHTETLNPDSKESSNPVKLESTSRALKLKTLVSSWIKQKKKITDQEKQLLDLIQTLPTNKSNDWEKLLKDVETSGLSSRQAAITGAIMALQGSDVTAAVISWLEKAHLYCQSTGLNTTTTSALMEIYSTLKSITNVNENRKQTLLKRFSNQSIREGQGEKYNNNLIELLAKLPVNEEQFEHLLQILPENTAYDKVIPFFGSWFNHLALYGPFDTDKELHQSWKKLYERFLSLSSNYSLNREYSKIANELSDLIPVKPLLQANTATELAENTQLVHSAISIMKQKESDFDDDYGSSSSYKTSAASYGSGYGSKPKSSSYYDSDEPSLKKALPSLTEVQKAAAQELFTKYPRMLFNMGFTVAELAEMGIDKELLKDFYDPIYAPYGVDSMGKPLDKSVLTPSSISSSSLSPASSGSKTAAISPLPSTLGMLYVKAYQGDEQAFTELSLRLLNEPNALKIFQSMLKNIEGKMDQYNYQNGKVKGHFPNEAEMMLLFKTKEAMGGEYTTNTLSSAITSIDRFIDYSISVTHRMTQIWGNIGLLAHAFRFWRFDTAGGPESLFAKFGFKPSPARANDSKYGKGYYISANSHPELGLEAGAVIEFRRGYLAVSSPSFGTLIVRNSSFVFGRDTLPHAAYFSPNHYGEKELLAVDPASSSSFQKILDPNLYRNNKSIATKLEGLLNQIFKVKQEYANWKFNPNGFTPSGEFIGDMTPGMKVMLQNLFNQFANAEMGLEKNPPALAFVHPQRPPTGEYAFEDENGLKQKHFVLDSKRIEELQDRLNGTWSIEKYPYSEWVSFIKAGVENKAELILVEAK